MWFDFSLMAAGFDQIGEELQHRVIRAGVRAAARSVKVAIRAENTQPSIELCLLAHGIACIKCKEFE